MLGASQRGNPSLRVIGALLYCSGGLDAQLASERVKNGCESRVEGSRAGRANRVGSSMHHIGCDTPGVPQQAHGSRVSGTHTPLVLYSPFIYCLGRGPEKRGRVQ